MGSEAQIVPIVPGASTLAKYVCLAQDHCFVGVCKSQELPHSAAGGKYWPPSLWCGGPVCFIGSHQDSLGALTKEENSEEHFGALFHGEMNPRRVKNALVGPQQ